MNVKLATSRGFCFGVEDAIELAEAAVDKHGAGRVVALGPLIHNKQVVNDLESHADVVPVVPQGLDLRLGCSA